MALAHAAIQCLPSINLNHERLECRLGVSLGLQQSREDQRRLTLSDTNDTAWFFGGGALSLEHHIWSAPTALPFGLHNVAATISYLVARRMVLPLVNNEFVGVIEHIMESLHDLLTEEPRSPSGSDSSKGSHHPSRECFMTGTPEGHVESVSEEEATPADNLIDEAEGETAAPPRMRVKQLKARHREIEDA